MSTSETGARCGCGVLIAEHREVSECAGDPRWPERTADEIERKLLAEGASVSYHPVPSGESPLEERLREYVSAFDGARDAYTGEPEVFHRDMIAEAAAELARLTAEAARLAAEREDHGPNGRNVTNAQHLAMRERALAAEAEAARYREALEELETSRAALAAAELALFANAQSWEVEGYMDNAETAQRQSAAARAARRALTERADHGERDLLVRVACGIADNAPWRQSPDMDILKSVVQEYRAASPAPSAPEEEPAQPPLPQRMECPYCLAVWRPHSVADAECCPSCLRDLPRLAPPSAQRRDG